MQAALRALSVIETPYCTQQTGGLTRGVTLRAIQIPMAIAGVRFPTGSTVYRRTCPGPGQCVQYATVHFYADGPSGPTSGQELEAQRKRLHDAGAIRIFEDVVSGRNFDRQGLSDLLNYARPGDVLCVVRLDRLGRSLRELLETVERLKM